MRDVMLDAALMYARKGWRVFPLHSIITSLGHEYRCSCGKSCESPGKHPRTKRGFRDATDDVEVIRRWWARWPDANIGVATGSGLAVLDVDGAAGHAELAALIGAHGALPETLVSQTGNGFHIYFSTREGGSEIRSTARGNLHTRGEGGYVVAPPSNHYCGRNYKWLKRQVIARIPDWLRQWTQGYEISTKSTLPSLGELPAHLQKDGMFQRDIEHKLQMSLGMIWSASEQARLEQALSAIPSDRYETWVRVGMALQALRWETNESDIGFQIWDQWSAQTPAKYAPAICEAKWQSFGRSRSGVTVGTIYHLAREHGWNPAAEITQRISSGIADNGAMAPVKMNGHHVTLPAELTARPIIWPDVNDEGRPRITMANTMAAIYHRGLNCRYDSFSSRHLVGGHVMQAFNSEELCDGAIHILRHDLLTQYGLDFKKDNVRDAVVTACELNRFNPVTDYLDGLRWDGISRIDKWLTTYMGAPSNSYIDSVGRLTLIAAVRRARFPKTKFDQVLVLEGKEGTGKSEAVKILASDKFFSDATILHLDERAQQEKIEGVWIYELSELNGIKRADHDSLKQFFSRDADRARPAYGHFSETRPRRCVFIGTTNRDDYLISETGNRRFWPVKTGRVDLSALRRDRDQLWAEAAHREARSESIILDEKLWAKAGEEQDKRMETDLWLDLIENFLISSEGIQQSTTVHEVLVGNPFLRIPPEQVTKAQEMRASRILYRLGYTSKKRGRTSDGKRFETRYFRE